jgi:P27 family predicted phage terminase small subunit
MARGRPRAPTGLLKLHGTFEPGKHGDRIDSNLPVLENISAIEPPATLTEAAADRWNLVVPALINSKLLAQQDIPMLEEAFILMGEYFDAIDEINHIKRKTKITEADIKKRMKLNAWMVRSMTACNSILCRFGVGPTERAKLTALAKTEEEKEVADPLAVVLGEE